VRGRFYSSQFTPDGLARSRACFEHAIALDARYALAHVGLADSYFWSVTIGALPHVALHKMAALARRALELDPNLGEAYATLGVAIGTIEWNSVETERCLTRAIDLSPSYPQAHGWYASWLISRGRTEEGLGHARKAAELDPLSLRTQASSVLLLHQAGLDSEAVAKADEVISLDRNYPVTYFHQGYALAHLGRHDEAVRAFETCAALMGTDSLCAHGLCFALVGMGRMEEARRRAGDLLQRSQQTYVNPWFLAMAHVAIGEVDTAFQYFRQAFDERNSHALWFGTDPNLRALHRDPRYLALLREMNPEMAETIVRSRRADRAVMGTPGALSTSDVRRSED
jgi:tetratricopeptide (TPR) repeat protein